MTKPTTALIDGDAIIFRAAFANEKSEGGQLVQLNPDSYACATAKNAINKILEKSECTKYKIFIADKEKTNYRYKIDKEYKANRKKQKRPEHEDTVREYLIKNWDAIIVKGAEVDDALGCEQTDSSTIICTNDKDLDMIPGWHCDIDVGAYRQGVALKSYKKRAIYFIKDPGFLALRTSGKNRNILVGGGQLWFCAQLLLGDSTDNIKHFYGVGPVYVYNQLKHCDSFEKAIKVCYNEYKKRLKGHQSLEEIKKAFLKQVRLVWIRRQKKDEQIFPKEWLT